MYTKVVKDMGLAGWITAQTGGRIRHIKKALSP
jgi:hypothetical protein